MKKLVFAVLPLLIGACSTSYKELKELQAVTPKIQLATQWVSQSGDKHYREFRQLPMVSADGIVYVANESGYVAALQLLNGKIKWQVRLSGDRIIAGPGLGQQTLVLVQDDSTVVALDIASGREKWRHKADTEIVIQPVIAQDKVLLQSIAGYLIALNLHDGHRIWTEKQTVPALSLRGGATPLVLDGKIVAGFDNGKLIAYDLSRGKSLWELALAVPHGRTDTERMVDVDARMYASGNTIYAVSYQGRVAAISARDGNVIWSRDMSSYSGITVHGDKLYLSDSQGIVWALDTNTGATVWRQENLADRDPGTPVVLGKTVVVGDVTGNIHWLSQEDGDFLARLHMQDVYLSAFVDWGDGEPIEDWDYAISATPVVAGTRVLVRDNVGSLAAFEIIEPTVKALTETPKAPKNPEKSTKTNP
ncbi:MAG: outer membrane protein assembly factor BamB [Gammaproteobacteria bacterium]|nr:outer membrane protein assembly factor BamB [Gammaproteobacteria bacterium]MDH5800929.1 outer membrane protein assembly factor BamB [Gammaproteobacteria bacterium]